MPLSTDSLKTTTTPQTEALAEKTTTTTKAAAKAPAPAPASQKTSPSPDNANPPAKTDGQRKPDNENFNSQAGKKTGVLNDNPPAKTAGQREPDVVSEDPAPAAKAPWVAKRSFTHPVDGQDKEFVKGETQVATADPILQEIPQLFEQVAAAPGEKRGA